MKFLKYVKVMYINGEWNKYIPNAFSLISDISLVVLLGINVYKTISTDEGYEETLKLIEKIHPSIGSILALLPIAIALDLLIGGFIGLVITLKNSTLTDMVKAIVSIGALILSVAALTKLMEKTNS